MKSRIAPVDGLRAFAVLGVMWAHVWMFYNNVAFKVGPIDIHRIISFGGIGVDLFFVISGFCMYLMYAKKATDFTVSGYGGFLLKRWKRIAPAFYFIVAAECVLYWIQTSVFPLNSFFSHLLFINTFVTDNVLSPPFWSLSTEWQFYLVLPFLFINDPGGKETWKRLLLLTFVCMAFRLLLFYRHNTDILQGVTIGSDKIWYRFIEFGWGIIVARWYNTGRTLPALFRGAYGFVIGLAIAYAGRLMVVTEVVGRFGNAAFVIKALGEPVMTAGFGVMLFNVISSPSIFSNFLSLGPLRFIGRISYSMYLWHWIICIGISHWYIAEKGVSALNMNVAYILSLLAVIPVAWTSFKLLEEPYFKRQSVGASKTPVFNG